ncbi:hypothetical protein LSTR_LSTR006393 [Laodelphax striatellus]|uniref:SAP domain-containing protein n=1 Tax=Laodelphax striatellus TaxID=195883 RepID=A0A482WWU9_LAOST|nr:hypothetical protein LSTR_LSTR006393 [Laodelphax striatellus]
MDTDLTKLTVVKLRQELSVRGLDSKGVKAVLVDRLREALKEENGQGEKLYVGPDLTNYRIKPVVVNFDTVSNCPPPAFVVQQRRELEANLQKREAISEASISFTRCVICLTNEVTRSASPCGHLALCVECCIKLVRTTTYYQVHEGLYVEEVPLPIRCPKCRSLVGSLQRIYW